jgi:hypothetical protein
VINRYTINIQGLVRDYPVINRYTINIQGLVEENPWVYSVEKHQRCMFYFPSFFSYNMKNAFLIKQKHRNDRVCLHLLLQKNLDSKTDFAPLEISINYILSTHKVRSPKGLKLNPKI